MQPMDDYTMKNMV